ncbi:MAG: hypothetical protein VXA26_10485 [Candidatus Neomarinimicrobiota bacterium]
MAAIIWNHEGVSPIVFCKDDEAKAYALKHEVGADATEISDEDFNALVRGQKVIDFESRHNSVTSYGKSSICPFSQIKTNLEIFKHELERCKSKIEDHLKFHNDEVDQPHNTRYQAHLTNIETVKAEADGGALSDNPSFPMDSFYSYMEARFGSAVSYMEIPV